MCRFEVIGSDSDRNLIRALAKRLADGAPESARLRAALRQSVEGEPPRKGGILDALRRSPMVGADIFRARPYSLGRNVDL